MDIQKFLDDWLAGNPQYQKYVTKLYYVPEGKAAPGDATHLVRLQSLQSAERFLMVAAVVVPQYAALLDGILALIATQPTKK